MIVLFEAARDFISQEILQQITTSQLFILATLILVFFLVILIIRIYSKTKTLEKQLLKQKEKAAVDEEKTAAVNNELDNILEKLRQDENKKQAKPAEFEDEQEDKAIISYQELKQAAGATSEAEATEAANTESEAETTEATDEPDSIVTDESEITSLDEQAETEQAATSEASDKFQNSEIISPVFGRIKVRDDYQKDDLQMNVKEGKSQPKHAQTEAENIMEYDEPDYSFFASDEQSSQATTSTTPKDGFSAQQTSRATTQKTTRAETSVVQKSEKFLESLKAFRRNLD